MREIVFRAKSIEGEWVYGGGVVYTEGSGYILVGNDFDRISSGIYELHRAAHIVDPDTVGEWTGLVDKYGKMIFEGDICKHRSNYSGEYVISVVTYTDGQFLAMVGNNSGFNLSDKLEVVGNKWDNPELIKGGRE